MTGAASPPRALHVVVCGGLAAGLLGKESFAGGAATAAIGLFLHFLIACGMAAVYWLACRRWPVLLRKPLAAGTIFGIGAYLAMTCVVVPLSRATPPPFILPWFIDSVLAHVILVGLPFAFVARWSANRR